MAVCHHIVFIGGKRNVGISKRDAFESKGR